MADKRIGTMSADKIEWPEQTISGKPYERRNGVSTITLGTGHFAVADAYPVPNQDALILELVEIINPKPSKATKESGNG